MIRALTVFSVLVAPVIGIAVLMYILVRSSIDFSGAKSGRVYIAFKALASLAAWLLASWGWFLIFYVTAYNAAGNGSAADEERLDTISLLFLDLLYALIGYGLALWVRHKSGKGP
jgi:hypothetical protein